ncbi:MAG: class I SAM-dependent methyltransferase, partial [Gemmatimonadota bacterium]
QNGSLLALSALHLARRSGQVIALDASEEALARGRENAALNGMANIDWQPGNAFDVLAELDRAGERFDTVVVDPPAFAKSRQAVEAALRGYHEINRRAIRLLAPGGVLVTASCSFHIGRPAFEEMLLGAAQDAGRPLTVLARLAQSEDHPEILTIPETAYLKGLALRAE